MTAERLGSPRKIAVLHTGTLGNFIMTLPALTATKRTYPEVELSLVTTPWLKDFLNERPGPYDKVISLPDSFQTESGGTSNARLTNVKPTGKAEAAEIAKFYKSMRGEAFDVLFQLEKDNENINDIVSQMRAALAIGIQQTPTDTLDRFIAYNPYQNAVLQKLEAVSLIGVEASDITPHIATTVYDEREIADILESFGGKDFIVLNPGASDPRLRWSPVKFSAVADLFTERGYRVILTGTPKEKPLITDIIQYMQKTAIAQTSLSFGGLAALFSHSSLVISNGNSPLHLARAVGARTVGISWAPNLLSSGPLFFGNHRAAISWQMECKKCSQKPILPFTIPDSTKKCLHAASFVDNVTVGEVVSLANELLDEARLLK